MRFGSLVAATFALLVIVAAALTRWRRRRETRPASVTDDLIRQIEDSGRVQIDEPERLDLGEIRAEEDEFWEQTWDEPEEIYCRSWKALPKPVVHC